MPLMSPWRCCRLPSSSWHSVTSRRKQQLRRQKKSGRRCRTSSLPTTSREQNRVTTLALEWRAPGREAAQPLPK